MQLGRVLLGPALRSVVEEFRVGEGAQIADLDHEVERFAEPLLQFEYGGQHVIHATVDIADETYLHSEILANRQ